MEILDIIHNLSLLTAVVLFFILVLDRWHSDPKFRAVFFGLVFGFITIIVMMDPFYIAEGLFFDGRTILLGLSGLFGGPIAATISAVIASFYRLEIDGVGTGVGIAAIIASSAGGVLFHYLFILKNRKEGLYLLFTGFAIHVTVLAIMLFLPEPLRGGGLLSYGAAVSLSLPRRFFYSCQTFFGDRVNHPRSETAGGERKALSGPF